MNKLKSFSLGLHSRMRSAQQSLCSGHLVRPFSNLLVSHAKYLGSWRHLGMYAGNLIILYYS
jgi:hypothetical protein